jgi:hypothetical protein
MREKPLYLILTDQIVNDEISVALARYTLIAYYRRPKPKTMKELQEGIIRDCMWRNNDCVELVSKELNMKKSTLYRRLKIMQTEEERRMLSNGAAIQQREDNEAVGEVFETQEEPTIA